MKTKIFFSSIVLSLFFYTTLYAQSFGGHPSHVKWQTVDTDNVRIIFPQGVDKKAFRIANIINYINKNNTYSVGNKSKKIDVVLGTNQVLSNGFVALAPYRSEFFGTAFQDNNLLGSLDWLDILTVHEYRHALQYINGRRGLTNVLYFLKGEIGWGVMMNLAIPSWYFEGDAVTTETVLSAAGRGRTPAFLRDLKANLLSNKQPSYMTSENGSYKNLIPNHYPMGYVMVQYVRNTYGEQVWAKILADAGKYRSVFYPFGRAMKRHTGKTPRRIYKEAYYQLRQDWERELSELTITPTHAITPRPKTTVSHYNFPCVLADGSIVAVKNSFKQIGHLVHIKDGKETKLCNYGIAKVPFLSENNGKLAWTELQQDPRRAQRNYMRVVSYDMQTKQKHYVTSKSKYFSPQFASQGNKIVVVKADENLKNHLVIIDGQNGAVIKELPNPENDFLSYPKWVDNDNAIVFVAKRHSKLAILKYDLHTQTTTLLTPWTSHTIGSIDVVDHTVYFSASYSGIDNIYTVDTNGDKVIKQITSVRIGAYQPAVLPNENTLVMVEYNDMGSALSTIDIEPSSTAFAYKEPVDMSRYKIKTNAYEHDILSKIPNNTYPVKLYKGVFKGLKLHSWGIDGIDNMSSAHLTFGNVLTDLNASLGGLYNKNENSFQYFGDVVYSKWFVEMGLHAKIQDRAISYFTPVDTLATETFKENNYSASLAVPLDWNQGSFAFALRPQVAYTYHVTHDYEKAPVPRKDLSFGSIASGLVFSAMQQKAVQNIQSRWGIMLYAQHRNAITSSVTAQRINVGGSLLLPGLIENHGLRMDVNWQEERTANDFKFVDNFYYARGYTQAPNDKVYKIAFNYGLPLFYPDWGFAGITYFKRIRANLFYDISKVTYNKITSDQNSYGVEVFFDNTFLNLVPFSLGFRYSALLNKDAVYPNTLARMEVVFELGL